MKTGGLDIRPGQEFFAPEGLRNKNSGIIELFRQMIYMDNFIRRSLSLVLAHFY